METRELVDSRAGRLAEFVVHLTDCDPHRAISAVGLAERNAARDPLEVVARAMVKLRRPPPVADLREPIDLRHPQRGAIETGS